MTVPTHTIHQHHHHCVWDNSIEPVVTIAPGTTITLDINDASGGQINSNSTAEVFENYDSSNVNPVTGPVFVDGAEPGDTLLVRLDSFAPSGWGWSANIPGFGLLADDFRQAELRHWHYDSTGSKPLLYGKHARIPVAPFTGTIGLAPAAPGPHNIIPPLRTGGNMDVCDLVAGSTLFLPVEVSGALLSIGDTHAAQGDGEVCGTAIESPMSVTVTVDLIKNDKRNMPKLESPPRAVAGDKPILITTGIAPDLMEGCQIAVREMIDEIVRRTGMPTVDAYILSSIAADLRISQLVDAPNWTVSFHPPLGIFD